MPATRQTPERAPLNTRCPNCGAPDPGLIDSRSAAQPVTCDGCGHESTLGRWQATADLTDAILNVDPPNGSDYHVSWHDGRIAIFVCMDDSMPIVATVRPADDYGLMHHLDVARHDDLLACLDDHGITVREEG